MRRLLPVLAAAALIAGCGSDTISQDEVETQAAAYLDSEAKARGGGDAAAKMRCPGDLEPKAGEEMRCTASDETGELTVLVRVSKVEDDSAALSFAIEE